MGIAVNRNRMMGDRSYKLPLFVFLFVVFLLTFVQVKVGNPILLLERFTKGGGWVEIGLAGFYGALVAYHMQSPEKVAAWRKYTWFAFSLVFFSQLILGLSGQEKFLMTGKLHLPVPMMILAGPLYRGHTSVMTLLFISTVILSGSACTDCMACTSHCKYDALNRPDILKRRPAMSCTLCGDCVSSCSSGAIHYKFLKLSPENSRNLYLFITISLHASTLVLARI